MTFRVPSGLDEQARFMFWRIDVVSVFVTFVFFGAMVNAILLCAALGIILAFAWQRFVLTRGVGFARCLSWWWFGGGSLFKRIPHSSVRQLRM